MPFPTVDELLSRPHQHFVMSEHTQQFIESYFETVKSNIRDAGPLLQEALGQLNLQAMTVDEFTRVIINTKTYDMKKDGHNFTELEILKEIGTVVPTYVYSNGLMLLSKANNYKEYPGGLPCLMGFTSAPRLTGNYDSEKNEYRTYDVDEYYKAIRHHLLPVIKQMNDQAKVYGKKLAVTIAGQYFLYFGGRCAQGRDPQLMYEDIWTAIADLLTQHTAALSHVSSVYLETNYVQRLGTSYHNQFPDVTAIGHIQYRCVASEQDENAHQLELSEAYSKDGGIMLGTIVVAANCQLQMGGKLWIDWGVYDDENNKAGGSLILVQLACTSNPSTFSFEKFAYQKESGVFRPKNSKWSWIIPDLASKHACQAIPISVIQTSNPSTVAAASPLPEPHAPKDAVRSETAVIEQPVVQAAPAQAPASAPRRVNNPVHVSYCFKFNYLAALSAVSAVALALGALVVMGIIAAPFCVGVSMVVTGTGGILISQAIGLFSRNGRYQTPLNEPRPRDVQPEINGTYEKHPHVISA